MPTWLHVLSALTTLTLCSAALVDSAVLISGGPMESFPSLTELDLSSNELSSFPEALSAMGGVLLVLDLSSNQLCERVVLGPTVIDALSNLEHLDLGSNRIAYFPQLGALTALKRLDLSTNALVALPHSIGALAHLEDLDLSGNRLDDLPPLDGLTALKKLDLGQNTFHALPASIGVLSNLERLDLCDNPDLRDLPTTMSCLTALTVLDVSSTGFGDRPDGAFPGVIFELAALTALDASECGVRTVLGIGRLAALRSLDLANCRVCEFDDATRALAQLCDLDISDNPGVLEGASDEAIAWLVRHAEQGCEIDIGGGSHPLFATFTY